MKGIPIKGTIIGGKAVIKNLNSFHEKLHAELLRTVTKLGAQLELLVKQKLSGPVLKAPTGNLKGSINTKIEDTKTAITASVGTSVGAIPYARIHEYGGTILPKNGPYLVFKTPDGAWHKVTQVVMPERSYLRSSLGDLEQTIEKQIRLACRRAAASSGLITK
jgi:phage gpG-like protein